LRANVASFEAGPEIDAELQAAVAKMKEELAVVEVSSSTSQTEPEDEAVEFTEAVKPKPKVSGGKKTVTRTRRTTEPEPTKSIKGFSELAGTMGATH
jgi:hypothetical protein